MILYYKTVSDKPELFSVYYNMAYYSLSTSCFSFDKASVIGTKCIIQLRIGWPCQYKFSYCISLILLTPEQINANFKDSEILIAS